MFNASMWEGDPFRHFGTTFLSSRGYMDSNLEPRMHRRQRSSPRRLHTTARQHSLFGVEAIEGSDFSEASATEDRYSMDDDDDYYDDDDSSTLHERLHAHAHHNHNPNHLPLPHFSSSSPAMTSPLKRVTAKVPQRAAEKLGLTRDSVLIMPTTPVTRLNVHVRASSSGSAPGGAAAAAAAAAVARETQKTLHVVVAGDMLFRDVVKQLMLPDLTGQVRVLVKLRGEWREPGYSVRVTDLVEQQQQQQQQQRRFDLNEAPREVDVKIELRSRGVGGVGGGGGGGRRRMGMSVDPELLGSRKGGVKAWEREIGREMWMY